MSQTADTNEDEAATRGARPAAREHGAEEAAHQPSSRAAEKSPSASEQDAAPAESTPGNEIDALKAELEAMQKRIERLSQNNR